jgi:ectoine hydroxylase-related dioxygenase (phytanoyl-CoA dioxygenase family)
VKKDSDYFASQSLWNLINHKKILDVVEKLLGPEILSNPVQNTRIKQPENKLPKHSVHDGLSGRTPWHQDAAVLSSLGQRLTDMVTVWIPFTKTTKKNGCMITVKEINKLGLLNHISGYRGQVEIKDSKLLNNYKPVFLEANVGDIIILHKHSIHCSLPNRSNDFRISADLRYNRAGTPSGRKPLPNFYVRSKNKKNITIHNYKQWIALWEKAKNKCIPRKYAFKYPLPTFRNSKRDLARLV